MTDKNILQKDGEHPFAKYVRVLGKGKKGSRSLTEEESIDAMSMILNNQVEDLQLGAFLMLLRKKEETSVELSGFAKAVKSFIAAPESLHVDLDWPSYAGKRRHLPWYIFSAMLVAQAGNKVFMHGASGHTANRLYTIDVLQDLGLPVCEDWNSAEKALDQSNFAYMPLASLSKRLADIINMRNILGLRSPVHSFARLINPLNADNVLVGTFHPVYSGLHQGAGNLLGYKSLSVIKGEGGEIERNPDNALTVKETIQGELSEEVWPAQFERRHVKAEDMSIEYFRSVWHGETNDEYGQAAVIGTTALALKAIDKSLTQDAAMNKAQKLWDNRDKAAI
jgi:anthranilate phosphoribosyltransferase